MAKWAAQSKLNGLHRVPVHRRNVAQGTGPRDRRAGIGAATTAHLPSAFYLLSQALGCGAWLPSGRLPC